MTVGALSLVALLTGHAGAQGSASATSAPATCDRSTSDAWWTGPMLANSATTLPHGHFLIEPYLFDVASSAQYGTDGTRRSAPRSDSFGSLTYIMYGLTDKASVGLIPTFGFNTAHDEPSSSGIALGDVTSLVQFRLRPFRACSWIPAMSVAVLETFPTGKYDRLGDRPNNGTGGGAYTTALAFYAQKYFWMPNGRILRSRLNVSHAVSGHVNVEDVSVYGTRAGFRGHAEPGASLFIDSAWEYSLTRSWVLALDVTYRHGGNTHLTGYDTADPVRAQIALDSGPSDAFGLAPAVEYSWTSNVGALLGARLIVAGRNTAATVTPAVAINIVR